LLPRELLSLFDDAFVRSCELIEEYVTRLALGAFRATGLERALEEPATVNEAVIRAGLVPAIARVPTAWLVRTLAARAWIESDRAGGAARYRLARALPALDPNEILAEQEAVDARCLPSYRIAALAAECYPAVLRGDVSGEQALFGAEGIVAWSKYFSNANPLYATSNAIAAIAAERALPSGGGAILELGGGLGSAAEALLDRLAAAGRAAEVSSYRLTDVSPLFLKRAQRSLATRFPGRPLEFAALDIDQPFAASGVAPGSFGLVYAVNVVHVSRDLGATLREIRTALADGGQLVLGECVRNFPGKPLYVELPFNLLAAFRDPLLVPDWRPNGGFLATPEWARALAANGFADIRIYPDIAAICDAFPEFVVAAITARRA
ncbi:MAG TPA: class I SAM-dependent methyltransferase, partial [Burkholderiales bacterium]|nr:class I SAM-dependent methyltransferase [Burkholderiales bacterium]